MGKKRSADDRGRRSAVVEALRVSPRPLEGAPLRSFLPAHGRGAKPPEPEGLTYLSPGRSPGSGGPQQQSPVGAT